MASLLDLPPELLDQIISLLSEGKPPSEKFLHEEPSDALLQSGYHPLKDLSQACRTTRELCFPSLFSAVRVDLNRVDAFLSLSESHNLCSQADSLVLYLDPGSHAENSNNSSIWPSVVQIVDLAKPSVVTVLLTASLFEEILPYKLDLTDQWAFSIRYQALQLRMPEGLAQSSQMSQETWESQNVFQIRKWSHCTFNQGSSISGYSSYEYFLKQTPCIFNPQNRHEFGHKMMEGSFENLTCLDYIAIFPIDHMRLFCLSMDSMGKLKCLRVQFAPTPSNNVLDNPDAVGKCQPGDLWQEFEACYNTLTQHISSNWLTGETSLAEFVSLDYHNPSLRELLNRVVGQNLVYWISDSVGGRWKSIEKGPRPLDD